MSTTEFDRLAAMFPLIVKWEKRMGGMEWYTLQQLRQAELDGAPSDSIYKRADGWRTIDDVDNPNVFRDFGIEMPDRLKFQVTVTISASFSSEAERGEFIRELQKVEKPSNASIFYRHVQPTDN